MSIKFIFSEKLSPSFFSFSLKSEKIIFNPCVKILDENELELYKDYCIELRNLYINLVDNYCKENPNKRMCAIKFRRMAQKELSLEDKYIGIVDIEAKLQEEFNKNNFVIPDKNFKFETIISREFTNLDLIEENFDING